MRTIALVIFEILCWLLAISGGIIAIGLFLGMMVFCIPMMLALAVVGVSVDTITRINDRL